MKGTVNVMSCCHVSQQLCHQKNATCCDVSLFTSKRKEKRESVSKWTGRMVFGEQMSEESVSSVRQHNSDCVCCVCDSRGR